MMTTLAHIFSSPAKIRVLQTLHQHRAPLLLRQIAYLSGLAVFSVQRTLKQLEQEGWLKERASKHERGVCLNRRHQDYALLAKIFELVDRQHLQVRSKEYKAKAIRALQFASTTREMFKRIKK